MSVPTVHFGSLVLLVGLMMTASGSASAAGLVVTVAFKGTGTGPNLPANAPFNGTFTYEETHRVSNILGTFNFTGSTDNHTLEYCLNDGIPVAGSGANCDPDTITTSGNTSTTFQLTSTLPGGNILTIKIPMGATLDQRHLPYSTAFPTMPTGATFLLTDSRNNLIAQGSISNLSPSEQ